MLSGIFVLGFGERLLLKEGLLLRELLLKDHIVSVCWTLKMNKNRAVALKKDSGFMSKSL